MDQDSPKGSDKRNWREKLGIGTTLPTAPMARDLPRIGDDYRKVTPAPLAPRTPALIAPRVAAPMGMVKVAPTVRPAPMAPRPTAKPVIPVRTATPGVSPEKLAERLRAQRDASEKFAEQRILVAKQKAEQAQQPVASPVLKPVANPVANPVSNPVSNQRIASAQPKFTFAEEDGVAAVPVVAPRPTVAIQASVMPPPAKQPLQANAQPSLVAPQIAPARPPLGATPQGYQQPRVQQPYQQPNTQQPYFPPQQQPYGNVGYPPQPNYRPIDPATGYPVQPQQYGQPYGGPSPQQRPYGAPAGNFQPQSPRLGMPPGLQQAGQARQIGNPNYQPQGDFGAGFPQPGAGFGMEPRGNARLPGALQTGAPGLSPVRANRIPLRNSPNPGPVLYDDDAAEMFEGAPPRAARRAATDYQQAYREVEAGYDDDPPRNKGPWILLGLLLLALAVTAAGVWYYTKSIKPLMTQTTTEQQQLPVVEAPATAAKVQPDNTTTAATPGAPTKKQIYDRIVGDREVLGGEVVPAEEVPLLPLDSAAPIPAPADGAVVTPITPPTGDSADPLPIPPPPGDGNVQGSLEDDLSKQSSEVITPAAGESQAAVVASPPVDPLKSDPAALPVPGLPTADATVAEKKIAALGETPIPETPSQEAIGDTVETAGLPSPKLRKIEVEPKIKKPVIKKEVQKSLGDKPLVLVPVSKQAKVAALKTSKTAALDTPATGGDSLFEVTSGTDGQVIAPITPEQPVKQIQPVPVKKKKTLVDLFNGSADDDPIPATVVDVAEPAPVTPPAKIVAPKPVIQQQVASTGGFGAQLASFRSKAEASAEFNRLRAKHGSAFQGVNSIISEAEVGGSTRFKLSVGGMNSKAAADAFCGKLFAAGERDCLVRNF